MSKLNHTIKKYLKIVLKDENPKDCIPSLQNFISLEMGNSTKNKDYVIGLINKDNSDTRDMIYISCSSIDEYKEWHSSIIEATGKDPMPAPKRERSMRKSGIGKKGVGDLANSRIGKSFIKSNLNQETLNVLSGLKKIIANENGKKLANKIEQDILMIITKTYLLLNNKKVDFEQLQKLYDPMNKAIRILCKCYAAKSRLNSNVLERALLKVGENIKMVEKILTEVLQPHLSSKSMFRLIYVFGYLSSTKFLELLIHEEDFEEDLQSFYDFMEYYSQFN